MVEATDSQTHLNYPMSFATWRRALSFKNTSSCLSLHYAVLSQQNHFRPQLQIVLDLSFHTTVHKQTNVIRNLPIPTNFLAVESFPCLYDFLKFLVELLPIIVPIVHDFDTSLHWLMLFCMFENVIFFIAIPGFDVDLALKSPTIRS